MSRKPAHNLRPDESRQAIWDWIRKQKGAEFLTTDVSVNLDSSTIREYLAGLHAAGYLEAPRIGVRGKANIYRQIKQNGQEAPRVRKDGTPVTMGLAREKMWTAMGIRAQKGQPFSVRDLTAGSNKAVPVSEVDAKSYCCALHQMGYLVEVQPGYSGSPTLYRMPLKKWTGPKPVQIQRTKRGYDPNTKEQVHLAVTSVEGGE